MLYLYRGYIVNMSLGVAFNCYMKENKCSQLELAENILHISRNTLNKWMLKLIEPNDENKLKIIKLLNIGLTKDDLEKMIKNEETHYKNIRLIRKESGISMSEIAVYLHKNIDNVERYENKDNDTLGFLYDCIRKSRQENFYHYIDLQKERKKHGKTMEATAIALHMELSEYTMSEIWNTLPIWVVQTASQLYSIPPEQIPIGRVRTISKASKKIKYLRVNSKGKKLASQEKIAKAIGVDRKTYIGMETGENKIRYTHLEKLAKCFNTTIENLCLWDD